MTGTGLLVGAIAGLGLLLLLASATTPPQQRAPRAHRSVDARRVAVTGVAAVAVAALGLAITALPIVAVLGAAATLAVPSLLRARAAAAGARAVASAWPDAIDDLLSSVRAGMSLPEAVTALARTGPAPLRPAFGVFADEYRASARFGPALDALAERLADPVADRVCAALRLARDVGGTELGAVLAALSSMLREEGRIRDEIAARQSWTVSAARLAVAAPWLTLALLCTRPQAVAAYATAAGAIVLTVAAALSASAYVVMRRIGRLPLDERTVA